MQTPQPEKGEPLSLDVISQPSDAVSRAPDEKTIQEIEDWESQEKAAAVERYTQDTRQRKVFAHLIYWLVVGWIVGVFAVLFCQGVEIFTLPLADGVLRWLVGGSTASIFGILYAVIANLFPSGRAPKQKRRLRNSN
ncbi:MAG: hypothetical protein WKH97_06050 [Casimicrobiaceae bacterium]